MPYQHCWVPYFLNVHHRSIEQVNNLREIQALRRLNPHSNVIELKEVVL